MTETSSAREWLEADGLGGFASGTVSGIRTRRYHALLLVATTPPTGRVCLVNGFDAWVETDAGDFALTSQRYLPGVRHPDGETRIARFESEPRPSWLFRLEDGTEVRQEILVRRGGPVVALSWRLETPKRRATLRVRPLLSGRDYHSLHRENGAFRFDASIEGDGLSWRPYPDLPGIRSVTNGSYRHDPTWYRNFLYEEERRRGLDHVEDLASPGEFRFDLARGEALWLLTTDSFGSVRGDTSALVRELRDVEKRRRKGFASPLHRAADAYIVDRREGKTIVAGYPWFTDWGRDTFIALRGLCLATGRLGDAEAILSEWADAVSEGMLPNRFPDRGEAPEFNAVDASLWYVVAVREYLDRAGEGLSDAARSRLTDACRAIVDGFANGTRFGIRADEDGLLAAGVSGVQLTWMDAKVGDWVVTPRIGKPVEVEALWLNALDFARSFGSEWDTLFRRGLDSFHDRFWYEEGRYLYDVVDVDHERNRRDASFRPNQILAVGGLPLALLDGERARAVVDGVEERLLTPLGLRSLAPGEPGYAPRYEGGVRERDGAYHQGTVWPWLLGPFIEAWVRVRRGTDEAKVQARRRFLEPLLGHTGDAGLGHLPEIADAEPPHRPGGCPFQAWSVGEALRAEALLR